MTVRIETRFLTPEEKEDELRRFRELRATPEAYRTAHPDAAGGEGYLDPEILPLCDALNEIPGLVTVQSCCGHRYMAPTELEPGWVIHPGILWLRMSEDLARSFEAEVGRLLSSEMIHRVSKLYAYEGGRRPHEVVEVLFSGYESVWEPGFMLDSSRQHLTAFFRSLVVARI